MLAGSFADTLLSGLVGGVIGGFLGLLGAVIVVLAEHHRWKRENKAATALVFNEVSFNLTALKTLNAGSTRLLIRDAWGAEQARVAALLKPNDLKTVMVAYARLFTLLRIFADMTPETKTDWLTGTDGVEFVGRTVERFREAQDVLGLAAGLPQPFYGD